MIDLPTNRTLTKAFIDAVPVVLTLIPRANIKQPAGGYRWVEQTPRLPQTFTLIEPSGEQLPTVTTDGVERTILYELLGEWNAELARGDVFTHQGKDFEVVELFHENGYERRAMVSARG